jgi:protein-disulfide isomerase-like protein with CxxC motif
MQEHARWGAHTALTEIAPYIQDLGRVAQQVPFVNQVQAAMVRGMQKQSATAAVQAVIARGELDQETVNNLLPRVYEMFNTQGPAAAIELSLQPDSIASGIELIHRYQTGGVAPVKAKAPRPRTLGAGNTAGSSKVTVSREVLEEIRRVEAKTGQKFTADEIKSFAMGKVG